MSIIPSLPSDPVLYIEVDTPASLSIILEHVPSHVPLPHNNLKEMASGQTGLGLEQPRFMEAVLAHGRELE